MVLLAALRGASAQSDSTEYLLLNRQVQYESTSAIHALYNFKFDVAEKRFKWMIQEYPEHPLPYYLMGLSSWWKIMPNDEVTDYDEDFFKYMDLSIEKAKEMYKADKENREAKFFLACAYGLQARFHSDRNNYTKAAFHTKRALNYLHKANGGHDELDPEFLLGDALYNYFREWIPENKPGLKPILLLFSKGDKELGIKQLQQVSNESFYTRIEAMNFMILVYEYEKTNHLALPIAKYLHDEFPDNSYFQRKYAKLNYLYGNAHKTAEIAKDYLRKYHANYPGYEEVGARYSSYFIAESTMEIEDAVEEANQKIEKDNKSVNKLNKKRKQINKNTKKYNAYSVLINNVIQKKNAEIQEENDLISDGEVSKHIVKYNSKIEKKNEKIDKLNKVILAYNSKVDNEKEKMMRLNKKYRMMSSFSGDMKYSDSTEYYLKQTVKFGDVLGYQEKNYHINSLYYLAQIALKEGRKEDAAKYYEQIIEHAPNKNILKRVAKRFIKNYEPS